MCKRLSCVASAKQGEHSGGARCCFVDCVQRLRRKNDQWHGGGTCILKDGDMPDMKHRYAMLAAMAKQVSAGWRKAFECC